MSPVLRLLRELSDSGIVVTLRGDSLEVGLPSPEANQPEILRLLLEYKPRIIPILQRPWAGCPECGGQWLHKHDTSAGGDEV